jgi:mannose-6-phosphate isomerase-like protein (cupin superfamily)
VARRLVPSILPSSLLKPFAAGYSRGVPVDAGVCVTIPLGTHFQFRSFGDEPLAALGVTMPPWPGPGEAYEVEGKWTPSARRDQV